MKKTIMCLMMFALFGCDQSVEVPDEPVAETGDAQTGIVLETIDVETYLYSLLDIEGREVWIASNPLGVSKGDKVKFYDATLMKDFHSKVLDRTFEEILFVGDVKLIESSVVDISPMNVTPGLATNPHENIQTDPIASPAKIEVLPLEGGMTIATIFAEHEQIEGQEVKLRAKVTKFSANILGKNWVTLQDGTGIAPDNELVATSSETVAVNDEVVVKGKVKNNVDIGAGYAYKVLLEDADFE